MSVYCQRCQTAAAVVHVTELKGGKKLELHLCEECADAADYSPKAPHPSMLEFLQQVMENATKFRDRQCPDCGMTFSEFKAKGRFGCARDYDVFLNRLLPLLDRVHEATEHVAGETAAVAAPPAKGREGPRSRDRLSRLRAELKRAIQAEEYEKAAGLRDKIRELEQHSEGGPE